MADAPSRSNGQDSRAKSSWGTRLALVALGLLLASAAKFIVARFDPRPMPPSSFDMGGDFTLQGARGPVSLHDFRGKVVVVYFGYTHCPDECPTALANVAAAFRFLNGAGTIDKVQGMFVTLDPERDSVQNIDVFARYFHNRIAGLSGTSAQIAAAAKAFKVSYETHRSIGEPPATATDYTIDHSGYIYIVRPDGQTGDVLSPSATPKDIVEAIKPWLGWASGP